MSATSSCCVCNLSHHALFQVCLFCMWWFSPRSFLICVIFIKRNMLVVSVFDCQTIYWINDLSDQSQWHSSKESGPAWYSPYRARGTARCSSGGPLYPWQQLNFPGFITLNPPPPCKRPTTTYSYKHVICVIEREFKSSNYLFFNWQQIWFTSPTTSIHLIKAFFQRVTWWAIWLWYNISLMDK